jgi:hypothetical protein
MSDIRETDMGIEGGRYIDSNGYWINAEGKFIDADGKLVDEPIKAPSPRPVQTPRPSRPAQTPAQPPDPTT